MDESHLPHEPTPPPNSTPVSAGSGLPENLAGALSYLLGPITGIVFFLIDRERPFVRFHAVQSLALTVVWIALWVVMMVLGVVLGFIPVLGWLVQLLLSVGLALGGFVFWLWLMYTAYQGRTPELPVLGEHVRRIAAESGPGSSGSTSG